jgi:hypothetical protein
LNIAMILASLVFQQGHQPVGSGVQQAGTTSDLSQRERPLQLPSALKFMKGLAGSRWRRDERSTNAYCSMSVTSFTVALSLQGVVMLRLWVAGLHARTATRYHL